MAHNQLNGKKAKTSPDDEPKRHLFHRFWSEDDEIAILKGLIDYKTEKNVERATANMVKFHEYIKQSLHVDASRVQLAGKVEKMKSKYVRHSIWGKDPVFWKFHEKKIYELSKQLWGSNSHISETQSKKNHSKKMKVEKMMDALMPGWYRRLNDDTIIVPEETLKAGLALADDFKRAELEEMWKELKEQMLLVYSKRLELMKKEASVALEEMWKELKEQELLVYVKRVELMNKEASVALEAIRSSGI